MLLAVFLLACAENKETSIAPLTWDQFSPSQTIDSTAGLYTLELQIQPEPPTVGLVSLDFAIYEQTADTPLENASIVTTPWMPSMDHGISDEPSFQETEIGLYNVQFAFSMSGAWEVQIAIDAEPGQDQVNVQVEVQ